MSDKIRINSIELQNYRQYYGKHKVELSSRDEGFTVIAGKNGEGKSNLLNAISWCLYQQEPHGMKDLPGHRHENMSLPVINNRYITELDEEKRGNTSVKIWIEKGDTIYSISRVLTVIKHKLEFKYLDDGKKVLRIAQDAVDKVPQGCEVIPEQSNFVIKKKGPQDVDFADTYKDRYPNALMDEILPKNLSKYFLLDGEFLEGFWKDSKTIQTGIEQISQLHLLNSLETHLVEMCILPKGVDRKTDTLTTRINQTLWEEKSLDEYGNEKWSQELRWKSDMNEKDTYYHASGKPLMDELEEDISNMEERITNISVIIGDSNSTNMRQLKQNKIDTESAISKEKENMEETGKKYSYNLITKSPYVFLKDAIEDSVCTIEKRMAAGDLPIRQRRQFADDLLKRNTCICGESLASDTDDHNTNKRRSNIEGYKNKIIGADDLDAAVDMKYDFNHDFVNCYDDFLKNNFGKPRIQLAESTKEYQRLTEVLRWINTQLKDHDGTKTQELINEQEYLVQEIQKMRERISSIKIKINQNSNTRSNLKIELDKVRKKNEKIRKLVHGYETWTRIKDHIHEAYEELKKDIRLEVQNNTWKNFNELLSNPSEFNHFTIDSDYAVYLLDKHDINKIRNLSAGQSLILTLAFVAALREPTGYRFPLVVDSPLGKIDGGNRYNIGTRLPEYLPDEQLTLLVTDTEYTANLPPDTEHPNIPDTPVAKLLDTKIGLKHFMIKKDKDGPNTGNSNILPAELKFDKDRKAWLLSVDV